MPESWNFVDMASGIANQIFKYSVRQNLTSAALKETASGDVLQKLGLSWVLTYAPRFYLNSKQISVLQEPFSFYTLLLEQIRKANKRIVLSSLYLGTGNLEENLVNSLKERLNEKENLYVKILLDCTRGSRGQTNSRTMVLPLLQNHQKSCQVSLYQYPRVQGPLNQYLPTKYKEIAGLQHIKIYLFDDNLIITGANLNNDYFTNRQDRYIFIENSKELSDFIEGLIDKVSEFSYQLTPDDKLTLKNSWPHDPSKTNQKTFCSAASTSIKTYYNSFIGKTNTSKGDTVIFPLLEMGPFGIHTDSTVTNKIFENCNEDFNVFLTTGYFNLTESYINTIIEKSKANYKILTAHPTTNGFYKASWPACGIPHAYTHIAKMFLERVRLNQQMFRIKMFEYKRPDSTFHAKGLWLYPNDVMLPLFTMIGSPNFGERSVKHDLECQFLLATSNEELLYELRQEMRNLYDFSHIFAEDICKEPDRLTPSWVKAAVALFRSYL